jgi:rSAM/selenodomain-associated transferase 2
MISVVIPALNEAGVVLDTIAAARAACPGAEIIVVDGGSRDDTVARVRSSGVRLLRAPRGRGVQLRAGVAVARGDVIVMLHADTRLPAGAAARIEEALADEAVVGGAFRPRFDTAGSAALPRTLRLYEWLLDRRSRWLHIMTGDQAIFARARDLRAIDGVPAVPLFEDVRLLRALRRRGTLRLLDVAAATSPRLFLRHGTARVAGLHAAFRLLHAVGVAPGRLAGWYPLSDPASVRPRRSARSATNRLAR